MSSWSIVDHLKLEMLVHRHRNLVASGQKRFEDEANLELLNSTSKKGEAIEVRLKNWSASKWQQLAKIDQRLSYINRIKWVPLFTCFVAFLLAILTWLPRFDQTMTRGGSDPMVINVTLFLVFVVLLPFVVLLFFLTLSVIRNAKHNTIKPLMRLWERVSRRAQKTNTEIHNRHAMNENPAFYQPILFAYIWCVKITFKALGLNGKKTGHDSRPVTQLPIGEALSQALMQQESALRLWSQRNLHLFGATFFFVFLSSFFLFSKSETPVFKSGVENSARKLSEINRFTIIGAPLNGLIELPTAEQIKFTQQPSGDSTKERLNARYDWEAYLMLAILFYGVLPRAALGFVQTIWLRYKLKSPDLRALRYESLIRGMTEPSPIPSPGPTSDPDGPDNPTLKPDPNPESEKSRFFMIGDHNLISDSTQNWLESYMHQRFKKEDINSVARMTLNASPMNERQFKEKLNELLEPMLPLRASDRILHFVDSGQSPKANYEIRTNRIREVVGPEAGIVFVLIHDHKELSASEDRSESLSRWTQRTRSWRDANLEVEEFYRER